MRVLTTLGALATAGLMVAAAPAPSAPAAGGGAATIRAADLLADVRVLADRRFAGRLMGTAGFDSAAAWASGRLAALGLRPGGDGDGAGWRQRFTTEVNEIRVARLSLACNGEAARACRPGDDFACRGFTGSGRVTAPVVFVGYGLCLPEQGWDDYAGLDVRGRVVLAFKQPPPWRAPRGEWGEAHLPRPKAATALAHGAAALLLVSLSDSVQGGLPIGSVLEGPGAHAGSLPQLHVSVGIGERLFAGSGTTLALARRDLDAGRRPASRALPATAALEVVADYRPEAATGNVIAILPGRDPVLAGQALVIGAHLDHVGAQGDSLWFPGANDNASGAAAVLALARAFATDGPARRTVIFALLAGEEKGLVGARWYVAHPVVPLDSTVAMFNLDCVAHGDSVQLGNGKSAARLWSLARELDAAGDRITVSRTWGGGGADAAPFHEAGVPALYFATTNSYRHLHRPTDTVETLNPPLHEALTRLAYRAARAVADGGYAREIVTPDKH